MHCARLAQCGLIVWVRHANSSWSREMANPILDFIKHEHNSLNFNFKNPKQPKKKNILVSLDKSPQQ